MSDKSGKTDAEKEINFSALKKHDDGIQHIIDTASSVAHYKFNSGSNVWEKTDVEGSLFLYSRKTAPYIIIFIMNRLNQDNAKLTLTPEMEFKVQEPFLLCKASNSEIIGIWFYDGGECRRFGALLNRFHALSHDERSLQISIMMEAQKRETSTKSNSPAGDNGIMGMFSQAQDEYTKSRMKFAQEQNKSQKGANQQQKKDSSKKTKIPFQRGISEPNLKSNPMTRTIEPMESQTPNPVSSREEQMRQQRQRIQDEAHREEDILYNLIHGTNKPRNRTTSSNIELTDGQRLNSGNMSSAAGDLASFNEFSEHFMNNHSVKEKAIDCAELESQLCNQIKSSSVGAFDSSPPAPVNNHTSSASHNGYHDAWKGSGSSQFQAAAATQNDDPKTENKALNTLLNSTSNTTPNGSGSSSNGPQQLHSSASASNLTSLTNHLLSPHVMLSGKGRGTTLGALAGGQQKSLAANFNKQAKVTKKISDAGAKAEPFPDAPSGAALKSLMSPAAFASAAKNTDKVVPKPTAKISKQDFRNIMIDMMQTDDEFVTKLHNTFLERLSSLS